MKYVNAMSNVRVVEEAEAKDSNAPHGKAHIEVQGLDDEGMPVVMRFTLNVAGMMGGIAQGVASRYGYRW